MPKPFNASVYDLLCDECATRFEECIAKINDINFRWGDIYDIEASASNGCPLCAAVAYGFNSMEERWPNQQILDKPQRKRVSFIFSSTDLGQVSGSHEPLLDPFVGELNETQQYFSVWALGESRPGIIDFYASITLVKLQGSTSVQDTLFKNGGY